MAGPPPVFLSYASRDRSVVASVHAALEARGIHAFFDRTSLPAGGDWIDDIASAIGAAQAFVVFAASDTLGRIQRREVQLAFLEQAKHLASGQPYVLIPVLLDGAKEEVFSGFLELFTRIDARGGEPASGPPFEALLAGLHGRSTKIRVASPVCPFRGLRAFREQDEPWFFGREEPVTRLLEMVHAHRLSAVIGPSGSGKSSVVYAGLVPRLRRQRPAADTWECVSFTPERRPFHRLGVELVRLWTPEGRGADVVIDGNKVGDALAGGLPLTELIGEAMGHLPEVNRLLVIVDQFEELFSLAEPGSDTAKKFVRALVEASADSRVAIVLTLRADFYGRAVSLDRDLADAISAHQVALGPMRSEELRAAIEGPAQRVGLEIEPGLTDVLVAEAVGQPGHLPLLEFALTELWQRRSPGAPLSLRTYRDEIGGLAGAIAQRAELVYGRLAVREAQSAAVVLPRLVRVAAGSDEGADTRERLSMTGLAAPQRAVLEAFAMERLVVVGRHPLTGEETAEVAHEALIRDWPRLRSWIDEDRRFLLWRQRLAPLVAEWEASGRANDQLLRGRPLEEAREWHRQRAAALDTRDSAFIRTSAKALTGSRVLRSVAALAVLLVAIGVWGWRIYQRSDPAQLTWLLENAPLPEALNSGRSWDDRHVETMMLFGRAAARRNRTDVLDRGLETSGYRPEVACMLLAAEAERRALGDPSAQRPGPPRDQLLTLIAENSSDSIDCLLELPLDDADRRVLLARVERAPPPDSEPGDRQTERMLHDLILRFVASGAIDASAWDAVISRLDSNEPGAWMPYRLAGILVATGQAARAERLLLRPVVRSQDEYERRQIIAELVRAFARRGQLDAARRLSEAPQKEENLYRSDTFWARAELAEALARTGDVSTALKTIGDGEADQESDWFSAERAGGLATVARVLLEAGDASRARPLLARARTLIERNPDEDRTSRALAQLAGAEAAAGNYAAARAYAARARNSHSALRAHALALLAAPARPPQ